MTTTETFAWPDTGTLAMPRTDNDARPDPVLEVLAMACQPWRLQPIWLILRDQGMDIPKKAEAEYAAALHWLIGFALRYGLDWGVEVGKVIKGWHDEKMGIQS